MNTLLDSFTWVYPQVEEEDSYITYMSYAYMMNSFNILSKTEDILSKLDIKQKFKSAHQKQTSRELTSDTRQYRILCASRLDENPYLMKISSGWDLYFFPWLGKSSETNAGTLNWTPTLPDFQPEWKVENINDR